MKAWWSRNKGWISVVARYLFGAAIIFWLWHSKSIDFRVITQVGPLIALAAAALVFAQMLIASWRVQMLLASHKIQVGLWRSFVYNAIGVFYSIFLPGSLSGDLARAYSFWRAYPQASKSALFGALFIDRLMGMVGMIVMGLIAGTFLMATLHLERFLLVAWIAFLGGLVAYVLITRMHHKGDKTQAGFWGRILRFFEKIDLRGYPMRLLVVCAFLSLVGHFLAVVVVFLFSNMLQSGLDMVKTLAVAPIGFLVNAIPLSPGGLGLGEKGFDVLYAKVGGVNGGNVFLLYRVFLFSPGLLGAAAVLLQFVRSHRDLFKGKHKADLPPGA